MIVLWVMLVGVVLIAGAVLWDYWRRGPNGLEQ